VAIVEQAPLPACLLDPRGCVVVANRRLEELLGAAGGGLLGRSLGSLAYPADAGPARNALASVFAQGLDRALVDVRCPRLDNEELRYSAWDLSPVRHRRGRTLHVLAVVRDLTEAMRSEHERRFFEFLLKVIGEAEDSDAMLTAAVQSICHFTRCALGQAWVPVDGALVCSAGWYAAGYGLGPLRSASADLRYQPGAGLPGRVWVSGQPFLLRDADNAERFDRAAAARRTGVGEAIAVPVETSAGLVAVLEFFVAHERVGEAGRLQRIARAARELGPIVERKRAEETLRASEERFRGVTGAAMDAIVSADSGGRLRSWNQGAERMFGWKAGEVLGRQLTVIIPERLRALHEAGFARVRLSGHSKLAGSVVELVALHRDGHEFPVELSIGAWRSDEGMQFSGVIRDITERRRAEEALAAASRELERTNAELETLVYSASHDLKSPMVSLLGYLEYLKLDYGDVLGEQGNHYVDRMSHCTAYMQRLIHDLIDLSRVGRQRGDVAEVDLDELVRTVIDEAAAVQPAATFHLGRLPVVAGDPVSFRQLLTNLVENALRHGGRPDVNVTVDAAGLPDGAFELSVRDDGRGVPPEYRERVFGVFERLDGPGTGAGTGMGLAICRKIVELLGGTIAIHGSHGTEVRIVLPGEVFVGWSQPGRSLALHDRGALV
jgi:PAS domain S-box-containing protein